MGTKTNYWPCRCTTGAKKKGACHYRVTLDKHPDFHDPLPKCPRCGGPLAVDKVRKERRDNPVCKCDARAGRDGNNMPHRRGSLPECRFYDDVKRIPFGGVGEIGNFEPGF